MDKAQLGKTRVKLCVVVVKSSVVVGLMITHLGTSMLFLAMIGAPKGDEEASMVMASRLPTLLWLRKLQQSMRVVEQNATYGQFDCWLRVFYSRASHHGAPVVVGDLGGSKKMSTAPCSGLRWVSMVLEL